MNAEQNNGQAQFEPALGSVVTSQHVDNSIQAIEVDSLYMLKGLSLLSGVVHREVTISLHWLTLKTWITPDQAWQLTALVNKLCVLSAVATQDAIRESASGELAICVTEGHMTSARREIYEGASDWVRSAAPLFVAFDRGVNMLLQAVKEAADLPAELAAELHLNLMAILGFISLSVRNASLEAASQTRQVRVPIH